MLRGVEVGGDELYVFRGFLWDSERPCNKSHWLETAE